MSRDNYPLNALSEALAKAVSLAGQSTVMVNARRRIPASGVAYKTNLIITADHAIERDADISIGTQNTDEHTATVLGRDPSSDLALLELEHNELMPGNFVLEPALVGQLSLALGRPSLNGIQASLGIVSAVGGLTRTRRGGLRRPRQDIGSRRAHRSRDPQRADHRERTRRSRGGGGTPGGRHA